MKGILDDTEKIISVEEINQNYFTLREISKKYDKSYANLSRKAKLLNIYNYSKIYKLGNRFIVFKDDIAKLTQDDRKNKN